MDGKSTRGSGRSKDGQTGRTTAPLPGESGKDVLRGGDARAAAGDWVGAIRRWRVAAADGAEEEARARLYAFVRRNGGAAPPSADGRLPAPALRALTVLLTASLVGTLAFVIAGRTETANSVLLVIGWSAVALAATAALLFAARSGSLSGAGDPAAFWANAAVDELAARAEAIAAGQARRGDDPSSSAVMATR